MRPALLKSTHTSAPEEDEMGEHTPGPWIAEGSDLDWQISPRHGERHSDYTVVPWVVTGILPEADARLIAASPDLLHAALFTLRHVIAGLSAGTQPEPQVLKAAHQKLFAAIDKASEEYRSHARESA
jgi:hypothetical protein